MYEIKPSPGKGLGVFATRDIKRAENIMNDAPILCQTFEEEEKADSWYACLKRKFDQLSPENKGKFMSLSYYIDTVDESLFSRVREFLKGYLEIGDDDEEALQLEFESFLKIMAIYLTNTSQMLINYEFGAGVFTDFSRINHSCFPNADWSSDGETELMMVRATRDIAEGEEITITYINELAPLSQRKEHLWRVYGFTCNCAACEGPDQEMHEQRRQETLARIDAAGPWEDSDEEYDEPLEEEGVDGPDLPEGSEFCGNDVHIAKGQLEEAADFGDKAMENLQTCRGHRAEDDEEDGEEDEEAHA
ncbi:SET domain-containing protein [Hypoxylon sp. NC0597]|nr:SET domain-containing protein [Hypoxylon sp. NC0597]